MLFLGLGHKQETRRFGPLPKAPAIPMSGEEKAARRRAAAWSGAPHLVAAVGLVTLPLFVPRTSPIYPYLHPVAVFLPLVSAGLVGRVFQKSLARFTRKTPDDGLTWRARQLGQTLGVRMPDVSVEDSSRAAHLAFAEHRGHHVTLSRKLCATFTPAETDFVLAYQLACMKRGGGAGLGWVRGLAFLPTLVTPALVFGAKMAGGSPSRRSSCRPGSSRP